MLPIMPATWLNRPLTRWANRTLLIVIENNLFVKLGSPFFMFFSKMLAQGKTCRLTCIRAPYKLISKTGR